ncbi:MAG TPA: MAPEG family protein [Myxococcota bacterium]|nr:MAPEG family protein [Myxococcota bacterium]
MTVPLWCLLGFVLWTTLLLVAIGAARVAQILGGKARPSDFPSGVPHGGDRYWRLNRAHLNCLENLPLFAAVVLTGAVIGADAPILDTLALVYLGSRVGQSLVHISSGSDRAVQVRFAFFLVQIGCLLGMVFVTVPFEAL